MEEEKNQDNEAIHIEAHFFFFSAIFVCLLHLVCFVVAAADAAEAIIATASKPFRNGNLVKANERHAKCIKHVNLTMSAKARPSEEIYNRS